MTAALSNRLLECLPTIDRLNLLAMGEQVSLSPTEILQQAHQPSLHVYFPTTAVVTLFSAVTNHVGLQTNLVGSEGMVGAHVVLGYERPCVSAVVQHGGWAWRFATKLLMQQLSASQALKRTLDLYALAAINQLTTLTICLHYHDIEQRLARWLLDYQDRVGLDHFYITHETLSKLLGVRRVGITNAANRFKQVRLIGYERGNLRVLDRAGLKKVTCCCYDIDQKSYTDLFG